MQGSQGSELHRAAGSTHQVSSEDTLVVVDPGGVSNRVQASTLVQKVAVSRPLFPWEQ